MILKDDLAIGMIGCVCMDKENEEYGLYYQLSRNYRGKGYAYEAAQALLKNVLEKEPNSIFKAEVVSGNQGSVRVLSKLGFIPTYTELNGFKRNGLELDLVHYEKSL